MSQIAPPSSNFYPSHCGHSLSAFFLFMRTNPHRRSQRSWRIRFDTYPLNADYKMSRPILLRCALTVSVTFFHRFYFPHTLSLLMARRRKSFRPLSTTNSNPRNFVNLENSLYREASNLSSATGANIAVICRRPSGEVRLWGYPSAQDVIKRYQRLSRRQISEGATPVPALVQAAEARARHYADLRRREEELNGSLPSAVEQIVREQEWMIESLNREIEGVRKQIAKVIAKSGEAQSLVEGSTAQTGVNFFSLTAFSDLKLELE